MSTLFYERTPFDILVRNFFQDAGTYLPLAETKVPHPVDIYTNDSGLTFEIAATGIAKVAAGAAGSAGERTDRKGAERGGAE